MNDVEQVLSHFPLSSLPSRSTPLGTAGGLSGAQFWRIDLPGRTLILRRWPTEHPSPGRLRFIHAILEHASHHTCDFLPLPLTTRTGESFVAEAGHLWELAPWMPGAANYATAPTPEKLFAAMRALGAFHNATTTFRVRCQDESLATTPPSAIHRHLARLRDFTPRRLNELANAVRSTIWHDLTPLARQFLAALPNAMSRAIAQLEPLAHVALPLQPCLRDIWHDHVLFTGNEVTGLVDFGAIAIDTPATDISRLVSSLSDYTPLPSMERPGEGSAVTGAVPFSHDTTTGVAATIGDAPESAVKRRPSPSPPCRAELWQHALAAYNAVRPLTESETRAAQALSTSAPILAGCNWLLWIYVEGREFENHAQVIERFRHIVANVGRL